MADDKSVLKQSSYRERLRSTTCELCYTPIDDNRDVCERCERIEAEREDYRESMRDAGRGHLLG